MKLNVNENKDSLNVGEMESLSNRISENLTFRCRNHHMKMKPMISRGTRGSSTTHPYLPVKCRKCFSRKCSCSDSENSCNQSALDSLKTLKKLLREQTLIQEAVRRLQLKSLENKGTVEYYKSVEGNSEWTSHYTSYDSDSDVDC